MTIVLDEETQRWARIEAARRNTSVSQLVGELLRAGRVSVQVLQEFYVNATGLDPGLEPAEARVEVEALTAWHPIANDASLLRSAWRI